jgi:hypothetical protein
MILDLHRQAVSAIARQLERDRKTVRKYIERGREPPAYRPRRPRSTVVTPFAPYLRERIAAFPEGRRSSAPISPRTSWRIATATRSCTSWVNPIPLHCAHLAITL